MVRILAVIAARGGSKGVPRKNIKLINGKPLIAYTIEAAKKCPLIDKLIVSTDDLEIAEISKRYGAEVPFIRPAELATDTASSVNVLKHAVRFMEEQSHNYDLIMLLEPTSPLRDSEDITAAIDKLKNSYADSVIGAHIFDIDFSDVMKTDQQNFITPFLDNSELSMRRQDTKNIVLLGGGIYVIRRDALMDERTKILNCYHGNNHLKTAIINLPKKHALEIDTQLDFDFAEFLIKNKQDKGGRMTNNRSLQKSEEYWERAKKIIPCGTQCLSHGPMYFVTNVSPKYLERGKGCYVWDVDGNKYIDLCPGGYPHILGYAYEPVLEAVQEQMYKGNIFPMMHPLEVEVSELLVKHIPCAEMVRFGRNGADVTSIAIRLARSFTGRDKIAAGGYHGMQDWFICTTERNKGIPQAVKDLTFAFKYNDFEGLKKIFEENKGEIAAVILEPVTIEPPKENFLQKVKDLAHKEGAVLIYDEIITGFRFSMGGAQQYFGVTPDLATFAKALSNGFPISSLVGKKEIMELMETKDVFFSTTYGGETTGLAAAKATIESLERENVINHIWNQGAKLKEGIKELIIKHNLLDHIDIQGYPCWTVLIFKDTESGPNQYQKKGLFQQECMKRGLLAELAHGISFAHKDEDIKFALTVYDEVMKIIKEKLGEGEIEKYIEGRYPQPVFRKLL